MLPHCKQVLTCFPHLSMLNGQLGVCRKTNLWQTLSAFKCRLQKMLVDLKQYANIWKYKHNIYFTRKIWTRTLCYLDFLNMNTVITFVIYRIDLTWVAHGAFFGQYSNIQRRSLLTRLNFYASVLDVLGNWQPEKAFGDFGVIFWVLMRSLSQNRDSHPTSMITAVNICFTSYIILIDWFK